MSTERVINMAFSGMAGTWQELSDFSVLEDVAVRGSEQWGPRLLTIPPWGFLRFCYFKDEEES